MKDLSEIFKDTDNFDDWLLLGYIQQRTMTLNAFRLVSDENEL